MFCPKNDYHYTRYPAESLAKYEAVVTLLELFDTATVEYTWYLNSTVLTPPKNDVVLLVSSTSAVPPPVGKTTYGHQAILSYEIAGNTIAVKTRPEDANFSVTLRVVVKDAEGLSASAELLIDFKGDVLEFEEGYYKDMHRCLMKRLAFIAKQKKKRPKKPGKKPPKGPKKSSTPGPFKVLKERIAKTVHEIARSEPGLASELRRSFGHIPGVTLRPGLRPMGSRLKKTRRV
jgi:hypothetical protein